MVVVEVILDGRVVHRYELAPYGVPTTADQYAADVRAALAEDELLDPDGLARARFEVKLGVRG
jgi:hypothetical protein